MLGEWTQCPHPGCVMVLGHPGPHYATVSTGGAIPVSHEEFRDRMNAAAKRKAAMLAAADALAKAVEEVRRLWRDHMNHAPACRLSASPPTGPCNCRLGATTDRLDAALSAYRRAGGGA